MARTTPPAAPDHQPPRADHNAEWDADDDDRPLGDPADLKDEGPLKSLGKAVSSPLLDSEGDDATPAGEAPRIGKHGGR